MDGIRSLARKQHVRHIVNFNQLLDLEARIRNLKFYHRKLASRPSSSSSSSTLLPVVNPVTVTSTNTDVEPTTNNKNKVYAYGRDSDKDREKYLESLIVRPVYLEWLRYS